MITREARLTLRFLPTAGDCRPNELHKTGNVFYTAVEPLTRPPRLSHRPLVPGVRPSISLSRSPKPCRRALLLAAGWLLLLGSFCTKMNKAHCHYRKKQPTKSKPKEKTGPRRRGSIGTKRPVEPPQLTSGRDMVATLHGQSPSDSSGVFSLKRCERGSFTSRRTLGPMPYHLCHITRLQD